MYGSRVPWSSHCLIGLSTCRKVTQTLHDDPDDDPNDDPDDDPNDDPDDDLGLSVHIT